MFWGAGAGGSGEQFRGHAVVACAAFAWLGDRLFARHHAWTWYADFAQCYINRRKRSSDARSSLRNALRACTDCAQMRVRPQSCGPGPTTGARMPHGGFDSMNISMRDAFYAEVSYPL